MGKKLNKETEPIVSESSKTESDGNVKVSNLTKAQKIRSWSVVNAIVCGLAVVGLGTALTIKLVQKYKNDLSIKVNFATREGDITELTGETSFYVKKDTKFSEINKPVANAYNHTFAYWTMSEDNSPVDGEYIVENNATFYPVMTPGPVELFDGIYAYVSEKGQWGAMVFTEGEKERTTPPAAESMLHFTLELGDDYAVSRYDFNDTIIIGGKCETIPNYFLANCSSFNNRIIFPSGVNTIGTGFLYNCSAYNQKTVIPDNIAYIENQFMLGCTNFDQPIEISFDLYAIGDQFLSGCTKFNSEINFSQTATQPKLTSIGSKFLENCTSFDQTLKLPYTVDTIGDEFLKGCISFNSNLEMPSYLMNLGESFLEGCKAYNHPIKFNCTNLEIINDNFMAGCNSFNSSVDFTGTKIAQINDYFMADCTNFNGSFFANKNYLPENNSFRKLETVGSNFMYNCKAFTGKDGSDTTLVFPEIFRQFGAYFLYGTDNLSQIEIDFDISKTSFRYPTSDMNTVLSTSNPDALSYKSGVKIFAPTDTGYATKFVELFGQLDSNPYRNLSAVN